MRVVLIYMVAGVLGLFLAIVAVVGIGLLGFSCGAIFN